MTPKKILEEQPYEEKVRILERLTHTELLNLATDLSGGVDYRWAQYRNDPVRFVTEGLGESVWSKQVEILESVRDFKRTAVPACHAPGKSHIAARAIAWWVAVHAPETVRVVTTATTYRQVRNIMWPHIRSVVTKHDLPGEVLTTSWHIDGITVADGFSPQEHNEAAVQGIHAENLLIVVDEAGGIGNTIGRALEALMTGGHTRLLLLGNPPTNNPDSWFERSCNSPNYNVIPIDAFSTPNFTGEAIGSWASNLVDETWVNDVVREFGQDSPFVQARVYARFPRSSANATIPIDWIEQAIVEEPETEGLIRLGVDVAANGGDEFVIARADAMSSRVIHTSTHNSNAVEVAGVILEHIQRAQAEQVARGYTDPVRVKIDAIGVGWGVTSLLEEWGKEGQHHADIVAVNVAERAFDNSKFANQRAEMWWNLRTLLQPDDTGQQQATLCIDRRTAAQLSAPAYRANSGGRIQIESKDEMKRRGVSSPDRAEAVLLSLFEPPRRTFEIAPALSLTQNSGWF